MTMIADMNGMMRSYRVGSVQVVFSLVSLVLSGVSLFFRVHSAAKSANDKIWIVMTFTAQIDTHSTDHMRSIIDDFVILAFVASVQPRVAQHCTRQSHSAQVWQCVPAHAFDGVNHVSKPMRP